MFRFKVTPDDGEPFEVVATTRDIWLWERTTRNGGFNKLRKEMKTEDLYAVAYNAAHRHALYVGTLAAFRDTCDFDILPDEDAEQLQTCPECGYDLTPEPDPTQPEA